MREIDLATQDKIFISAYWRQRNADEPNIGYGLPKDILIFQIIAAILTLLNRIIQWFFAPKIRPLVQPWVRFALVLPILGMTILIGRGRKSIGFYQLDHEGRPVLFLSPLPPENIQKRMGVSRKKFLVQ